MIIASIVFILLLAASQLLAAKAMRQLTTEQKARVAETSSASTPRLMIAIAALYSLEVLLAHFIGPSRWLLLAFMVVVFLLATAFAVVQQRRLGRLDLPTAYLRSLRIGMLLTHAGMLSLFATMLYISFQLLGR